MEMRMDKAKEYLPHYTLGEEIFNSVSHGVGVALACVGFGILIVLSALYAVPSSILSPCLPCTWLPLCITPAPTGG